MVVDTRHGELSRILRSTDVSRLDARLRSVKEAFKNLREAREVADYSPADFAIFPHEALDLIGIAREAISALEKIDAPIRSELATLLLVKSRQRQIRR